MDTLDYHKPEPTRYDCVRWPFRIMAGILGAAALPTPTLLIWEVPGEWWPYALLPLCLPIAGAFIYVAVVGWSPDIQAKD